MSVKIFRWQKIVRKKESVVLHARCWFGSVGIITPKLSGARNKQQKGSGVEIMKKIFRWQK